MLCALRNIILRRDPWTSPDGQEIPCARKMQSPFARSEWATWAGQGDHKLPFSNKSKATWEAAHGNMGSAWGKQTRAPGSVKSWGQRGRGLWEGGGGACHQDRVKGPPHSLPPLETVPGRCQDPEQEHCRRRHPAYGRECAERRDRSPQVAFFSLILSYTGQWWNSQGPSESKCWECTITAFTPGGVRQPRMRLALREPFCSFWGKCKCPTWVELGSPPPTALAGLSLTVTVLLKMKSSQMLPKSKMKVIRMSCYQMTNNCGTVNCWEVIVTQIFV